MSTTLAAKESSSPRASLHMSAMGKVDTCASSARGVGTYRVLVASFLLASALRMFFIFVEDVVIGPTPLSEGVIFLGLAALSALWGSRGAWHLLRRRRRRQAKATRRRLGLLQQWISRRTASARTGTGSNWSR